MIFIDMVLTGLLGTCGGPEDAEVQMFGTEERAAWFEAVAAQGEVHTIDFSDGIDGEIVTDQYLDLGILFTDGNDTRFNSTGFGDDWGLASPGESWISVRFCRPQYWIGVDHPGDVIIHLSWQGTWFSTEISYSHDKIAFEGMISSHPFDEVVIRDPFDWVHIDNLHFGAPSPNPADVDGDGCIGVDDLLAVILSWSDCPPVADACPESEGPCGHVDIDGSGVVDVDDLLAVVLGWSPPRK